MRVGAVLDTAAAVEGNGGGGGGGGGGGWEWEYGCVGGGGGWTLLEVLCRFTPALSSNGLYIYLANRNRCNFWDSLYSSEVYLKVARDMVANKGLNAAEH